MTTNRFVKALKRFIFGIFGWPIRERSSANSVAMPKVVVVKTAIAKPRASRWYMTQGMLSFLQLIRKHEGGSQDSVAYNADYAMDDRWTLTSATFDQVRRLGRSQVSEHGEASSAIGAYQFLSKTLDSLKMSLGLSGSETFDQNLQDDLAVALMIRRGLLTYLRGDMTSVAFANSLAREWASLPVVHAMKGSRRMLKAGQSYYAGDGLNRAFHDPEDVLEAILAIKTDVTIQYAKDLKP